MPKGKDLESKVKSEAVSTWASLVAAKPHWW